MDISAKEFIGSLQAITLWGDAWAGKTVRVVTDNNVIVACSKRRTNRTNDNIAELFRFLFVIELKYRCRIIFQHIAGARNVLFDALSRNDITKFRQAWPTCEQSPVPAPIIPLRGAAKWAREFFEFIPF